MFQGNNRSGICRGVGLCERDSRELVSKVSFVTPRKT